MALDYHVDQFYTDWLDKADSYAGPRLSDYFNKSFSLFTLYNKLYAEATFDLARRSVITINNRGGFPDRKGATEYAPQYIGYDHLFNQLIGDTDCSKAINELIELIENEHFYIKLSMPYGERQPDKDKDLVKKLKSNKPETKIEAILNLIYSVRCNMFHGNKGFNEVQIELLEPLTTVLRKIITVLYEKLSGR